MSEKTSLSRLFEVVAESFPAREFKGFRFKVRKITESARSLATTYATEDARRVLASLPDEVKNADVNEETLDKFVTAYAGSDVEAIEMFGLDKIRTKGDLEVAKIAVKTVLVYVYALTMLKEDGTTFNREEITMLADMLQTQPEMIRLITSALDEINGQVSPNDQQPPVKP